MTRVRKFRKSHRIYFFVSKLVIIWYLMLFTLTYLNTPTDAVFTDSYEVKNIIHAELEEDTVKVNEKEIDPSIEVIEEPEPEEVEESEEKNQEQQEENQNNNEDEIEGNPDELAPDLEVEEPEETSNEDEEIEEDGSGEDEEGI